MSPFENPQTTSKSKTTEIPDSVRAAALDATVIVQGQAISRGEDGVPVGQSYTARGTGFFIDDRHVLTNAHLAENIIFDGTAMTNDGQAHHMHLVKLDDVTDLAEYELDDKPAPGKYQHFDVAGDTTVRPGQTVFSASLQPDGGVAINSGHVTGLTTKDAELARLQDVVAEYDKSHGFTPPPGIHERYTNVISHLDPETRKDAEANLNQEYVAAHMDLARGASGSALSDLEHHLLGINALAGVTSTPALASKTRDLFITLPEITAFLNSKNNKFNFGYSVLNGHSIQTIERANHSQRRPFNVLDDVDAKM